MPGIHDPRTPSARRPLACRGGDTPPLITLSAARAFSRNVADNTGHPAERLAKLHTVCGRLWR